MLSFADICLKNGWPLVLEVASPGRKLVGVDALFPDTIPKVVVRRGTRPDIPDAVGKNLEGYSWIVVLTWSGNTKGTRACTKSVRTLKMFRSRECKIRTLRLKLIA